MYKERKKNRKTETINHQCILLSSTNKFTNLCNSQNVTWKYDENNESLSNSHGNIINMIMMCCSDTSILITFKKYIIEHGFWKSFNREGGSIMIDWLIWEDDEEESERERGVEITYF